MFRSPETVLRAKSIAIVGASERAPWARHHLSQPARHSAIRAGSSWSIRGRRRCSASRAFPSLRDAAGAGRARDGHRAGGRRRRRAGGRRGRGREDRHVYSAAMGDGPDPESHKRGAWLKDFLGRSKIKVAGPNCMGAYSYHEQIFAYPNSELCRFPAGSVGAAFQSGGTLQFWLRTAADRGLRFSYGITSGNEISFDLADYLNFLVDDPNTQRDRAVHRGHPPARRLHGGGRARARSRQADRRDQDRRHREVAGRRAVAHRRDRRRLRRLSRDVRALRHLNCRIARRHDGGGARLRRRPAAEGPAHRLRHDLRRHRRSALRLCGGRRRARCRTIRRRRSRG